MDREELKKEFSSRESQRIFLFVILVTRCRYRTEKRSIIGNNRLVSLLAVTSDLINHENKRLYFKEFCFVLEYYPTISELDRLIINWGEPIGGVTFIVNIFFIKMDLESIQNLSQSYAIWYGRYLHGLFIL